MHLSSSPLRGTFPAHLIFLELISLIIIVNEYKSPNVLVCSLLILPSWDQMSPDDPVFEHCGLLLPRSVLIALADFLKVTIFFEIPARPHGILRLLLGGF
jgi:hypothetical protein